MAPRVATPNGMQRLRIALEWFLNPDHLPLLAAQDRLRDEGLEVELVVPDEHYDGFESLARGDVELVVNEPLHLVEQRETQLLSYGCFFATDGGVLLHRKALDRLVSGEQVRIASPVSNPTTDQLCKDILSGWVSQQGGSLEADQIFIEPAGFAHVDNLATGYDGAWLAFANVEGVSAQVRGLDTQLITTAEAGIPNFSALELSGAAHGTAESRSAIGMLVSTLNVVIPELCADPVAARRLWYAKSGEQSGEEVDAIVNDTLGRFLAPVCRDVELWRPMWRYLHARGGDVVDKQTFEAMFI